MNNKIDKYLTAIYYDPVKPASFSSASKLWAYIRARHDKPKGLQYDTVKKWLKRQTTQTIHATPVSKFETEKIIVEGLDDQWGCDLLQMDDLAQYNRGYKHLLLCIDLFSRYLWCRPLKNKTATATAKAFKSILDEGRQCETLRTDQGKEFLGRAFQQVLKEYDIYHLIGYGPHKAAYAERVNQTIEGRLYKYFYENQTFNYIDVLDEFIKSYNHTVHSSIGVAPATVTQKNAWDLYERIYIPILNKRAQQPVHFSFEIGDLVRLSHAKSHFERGYQEKWTEELFKIQNRIPSHPPRYKVKDLADEIIKGSFYEDELQKVHVTDPDNIEYKIERVISTKVVKGKKYSLVKWYGYKDTFNSYIPSAQLKNYKGKTR